ncbi:MAG: SRPBCC family protein [Verrucomicrobiota bacterium]
MPALNVSKSIHVEVAPEVAYETIRDFRKWPIWSPWLIVESGCRVDFALDGNSYTWDGEVIGSGSLAIRNEEPSSHLELDLEFLKPWKSHADVRFDFREENGGTEITWSMESSLPFFLIFLKKTMVAAIGMDYERGLKMLKDYLETGSVPSKLDISEKSVPEIFLAGVTSSCSTNEIGRSMEADLGKLKDWLDSSGVEPSGRPRSIYHKWDVAKQKAHYTIGFPVSDPSIELPDGIEVQTIPALKAFAVTHTGPFRHLGNAWSAGVMHERAKKFQMRRGVHPFEIYETLPGDTPENEEVTVVHFPLKE